MVLDYTTKCEAVSYVANSGTGTLALLAVSVDKARIGRVFSITHILLGPVFLLLEIYQKEIISNVKNESSITHRNVHYSAIHNSKKCKAT